MKHFLRGLACAAGFVLSASAAFSAPNSPEIVIDVATGQVLHADEATRYWYPASTTKMMTAYLALRALKAGQISLDTPLIASKRAAGQKPSKLGIRPGQEITLDNALKIMMVKSANDLAVVIAEGVGGSVETFAQMMNNEAQRLGMRESHFVNPHGFHDPNHYTSARDLAILGRTMLVEFPQFREYWGIGAVRLGGKVMQNTNGLIGRYPGAMGLKTGFVCPSGFNVVGVAYQGGRELLTVVMGAGSAAERTIRAAQLFDKGFSGGGSSGSLTGLAHANYGAAPNMRGEICSRGRMRYLSDDDAGGALAYNNGGGSGGSDNASVFAIGQPVQTSTRVGSSGGGRPTLGPRALGAAVVVYLGRAPGSTAVARGAGNGAVFGRAVAAAGSNSPSSMTKENDTPAARPVAQKAPSPGAIGLRRSAEASGKDKPGAIAGKTASKSAGASDKNRPGAIAGKEAGKASAKGDAKTSKVAAKSDQKTSAKTAAAKTAAKSTAKVPAKSAVKTPAKVPAKTAAETLARTGAAKATPAAEQPSQ